MYDLCRLKPERYIFRQANKDMTFIKVIVKYRVGTDSKKADLSVGISQQKLAG